MIDGQYSKADIAHGRWKKAYIHLRLQVKVGVRKAAISGAPVAKTRALPLVYNIKERQLGPAPHQSGTWRQAAPTQVVSARHAGLLAASARLRTAQSNVFHVVRAYE